VLDIFLCHTLYLLRRVGEAKVRPQPADQKNQVLIFPG
jgi:hypothetical protein